MPPHRVYYPSVTVSIGLRFDQALHVLRTAAQTATNEISRRDAPNALVQFLPRSASLNDRTLSAAEAAQDAQPGSEPLFVGTSSDSLTWLCNVVPRVADWTKPGYGEAGSFSVTLGFNELPIDPVFIAAAQIRLNAGCVDPSDFAKGMTEVIPLGNNRFVRKSVLESIDTAGLSISDKLMIWGVADKPKVRLDHNPTLTFTGRDLRSIFMSTKPLRGDLAKIDLSQPIDDVVRQVISIHPMGAYFKIQTQPGDWPNGIPSPGAADNVTAVNLGTGKKTGKGGKQAVHGLTPGEKESKLDYWQAICQWCYLVGAVPYIRGANITVRPAQSMYDLRDKAVFDPLIKTPFANNGLRQNPNGTKFAVRKLIYGYNAENIEFERNLQGVKRPKVIQVVSLDTSSEKRGKGKLLVVEWPEDVAAQLKKKHVTKESPSGQLGENEVERHSVPGIRNKDQLREIAKAIFETTGRGEVHGSFETKDLASYGAADPNADPDWLRAEIGDPVEFSVAAQRLGSKGLPGAVPIVSNLTAFDGQPFAAAVADAAAQLGDENFARAIVASRRDIVVETQSIYRLSKISGRWNALGSSPSLSIHGEFHNFIEARYGPKGIAPTKSKIRTVVASQAKPKTPGL